MFIITDYVCVVCNHYSKARANLTICLNSIWRETMGRIIIVTIFLIGLTGCAGTNLITHGEIQGNIYVSNVSEYAIETPVGWIPTFVQPEDGLEKKINKKLVRTREVGYITKVDGSAHIMIEIHTLTWAKEPVSPHDITNNRAFSELFTNVCEKMMKKEQSGSGSIFASSTFECFLLDYRTNCLVTNPCAESTRTSVSSRPSGNLLLEKVYIIGDYFNNKPGWRVHFTLTSPPDEYQENLIDFEQAISSMFSHVTTTSNKTTVDLSDVVGITSSALALMRYCITSGDQKVCLDAEQFAEQLLGKYPWLIGDKKPSITNTSDLPDEVQMIAVKNLNQISSVYNEFRKYVLINTFGPSENLGLGLSGDHCSSSADCVSGFHCKVGECSL